MARDPIRVLYYPDFFVDYTTLLKAILLFDELHFMDRPPSSLRPRAAKSTLAYRSAPIW
ncbi:MAG: hypothetical protein LAP87_11275 [Acidobacteriia bacterium]|nr:hypothetical protein [Terriglobia bacterium]